MQVEVVTIVMKRMEVQMDDFYNKIKLGLGSIETKLNGKFSNQEKGLHGTIKNLEKYIEEVHSQ